MRQVFFDQGIIDEEFKKRRAKIIHQRDYSNRVAGKSYFAPAKQAVVKIIHHRGNIADLARYVRKDEKTDNQNNIFSAAGTKLSERALSDKVNYWRQRDNLYSKNSSRHSTHFVLSTREKPTKRNIARLRTAVAEVALNHFASWGYDSFFTIHDDKEHLHAHLVVHNTHLVTNKKIRFSKQADLFSLRKDFAAALKSQGWNYKATLRKDFMYARDGIKGQNEHQNYVLREVEKSLGSTARDWTKKQFILKYSDDRKKSDLARKNLTGIRNFASLSDEVKATLLDAIDRYGEQREKWRIKQSLKKTHSKFDENLVYAYVDSLFASQKKLERRANTRSPQSIEKLGRINQAISDLSESGPEAISKVSARILSFFDLKEELDQRKKTVSEFSTYVDPLIIWLKTSHYSHIV